MSISCSRLLVLVLALWTLGAFARWAGENLPLRCVAGLDVLLLLGLTVGLLVLLGFGDAAALGVAVLLVEGVD